MIKTFEEWIEEEKYESSYGGTYYLKEKHAIDSDKNFETFYITGEEVKAAYEAALAESKAHYEMEKIAIHEYYDLKIKELMGTTEEFKGSEKNNGKLS